MWLRIRRWSGLHGRGDGTAQGALSRGQMVLGVSLVITSIVLLIQLVLAFIRLPDNLELHQRCRMSRMWPSYVRHSTPSPSGLGTKYGLFLYRELPPGGQQTPPTGRPALFVPGNAGSYGQVRSVASSSRHLFEVGEGESGLLGREVDWWTVDFNEDFSAFHAETLREQAMYLNDVLDYLRQIYGGTTTVTVLAHSMGGIAARLMLQQDAHPSDSVKTLITLSSPHAYPPVAVDAALEHIYAEIREPLLAESVLLISLSGGILDDQLSSEGSVLSLARLWRPETSLHAFTASMAALWSGVDHLAMMWCDQLRTRIARGVLRIEADETQSVAERRQRWRKMLGIASSEDEHIPEFFFGAPFKIGEVSHANIRWQADVPLSDDYSALEVITNARVGIDSTFGPPVEHDAELRVDLCDSMQVCRSANPAAFDVLPPSATITNPERFPSAEIEYDLPGVSLRRLRIASDFLHDKKIASVKIYTKTEVDRVVYAAFVSPPTERWVYRIPRPPNTFKANFSRQDSSPSDSIIMHGMHSTLLAYRLKITPSPSEVIDCDNHGVLPILQVTSLSTGDTQYYPALKSGSTHKLMLHGNSPFMPAALNVSDHAFKFTLMMDACSTIAGFEATIDFRASVGLLLSRYRTAIVALPASAVLLASTVVWTNWDSGTAFFDTLTTLVANSKAFIVAIVALCWTGSAVQRIAYLLYGQSAYMPIANISFGTPTLPFFYSALLSLVFTLASYGTAITVTAILDASVVSSAGALGKMGMRHAFANNVQSNSRSSSIVAVLLALVICVAVMVAIPVQFVYLVVFMVQWTSCVRLELVQRNDRHHSLSASRQSRLLLHLMIWVLPLNAPILLIWSRNLLHGWYGTLGRSDHNILHVAGYLLATYIASTGESIPRARSKTLRVVTVLLFLRCAINAVLYGIRYTYVLGGSTNVLLLWLSFLYFKDCFARNVSTYKESEDASEDREVEQRLLARPDQDVRTARYSNLPKTILNTLEITPESIKASISGQETQVQGYRIIDKEHELSNGSQNLTTIDSLLEEYLTLLDRYMHTRQSISDTVARGVFQLSKARMQLGMPHMHEGWDARMQASIRVEVGQDGTFALVKVDLTKEDDVAIAGKSNNEKTVLRRRKKAEETINVAGSEEEEEKREKKKQEARPYDPLYQFSALPPQTLRQSRSSFESVVKSIVGVSTVSDNVDGLLNHMKRLDELEDLIRATRPVTNVV